MDDYHGNSHRLRAGSEGKPDVTPKNVEKVVVGEVVIKKKGLGRKVKDTFIEADFKSVMRYVVSDVLIPAARNMIVDGATKGVERMMYGESSIRRRGFGPGPRVTYNNPINRTGYRDASSRMAPTPAPGPRSQRPQEEYVLTSRAEAEMVLERMNDILENYEVVSVHDLNELCGLPSSHVDNKWGWVYLGDVSIRQIREGYLIDFPLPEPVN